VLKIEFAVVVGSVGGEFGAWIMRVAGHTGGPPSQTVRTRLWCILLTKRLIGIETNYSNVEIP